MRRNTRRRAPVCHLPIDADHDTEGQMAALRDFFSTDYGLMSAVVIAITLGMGVFYARFFLKHMREDEAAAAAAARKN